MKKNLLRYVKRPGPEDLLDRFPERLGRLPVVTHLDPLDTRTLRAILTEPKTP